MSNRRCLRLPGLLAMLLLVLGAGLWPARPVAAQGSTFVFFEKFPSSNDNQWNVQTLKDGSQTYIKAGAYHIIRPRPGTMRGWPLQVKVPAGFQFNVQLKLVEGVDPYAGVTFWDDLANSFLLFAITPDGKAGLFKHTAKGYTVLLNWRPVATVHKGNGAVNNLSVNMDALSAAQGRTVLVNGVPLGAPCKDTWRAALGKMPAPPAHGLFVGVLAGTYRGPTHVAVLRASMYDGTKAGPVPKCP